LLARQLREGLGGAIGLAIEEQLPCIGDTLFAYSRIRGTCREACGTGQQTEK